MRANFFDKKIRSMDGSIGGAFFACQGMFYIEKQGLAMRLGREAEQRPPF